MSFIHKERLFVQLCFLVAVYDRAVNQLVHQVSTLSCLSHNEGLLINVSLYSSSGFSKVSTNWAVRSSNIGRYFLLHQMNPLICATVFNKKKLRRPGLFTFNLLTSLPVNLVHTVLPVLIPAKAGISQTKTSGDSGSSPE